MCGIAGIYRFNQTPYPNLSRHVAAMNALQAHRGPDGNGVWVHPNHNLGLGHQRLSIIDLENGAQPMTDEAGNTISYNGEIYNYRELRSELHGYSFRTSSDTEVILAAYQKWGDDCVSHLRGMFAFAIWDEGNNRLFMARDRFGIKPFYYTQNKNTLFFSSEVKALLPFVHEIDTDTSALKDYLVFQLVLDGKTLFKDIYELLPGHTAVIENNTLRLKRYWDVYYNIDFNRSEKYFSDKLVSCFEESVRLHTRADVPVGSYISGGIDSSLVAAEAAQINNGPDLMGFTGKFGEGNLYDESAYARDVAEKYKINLIEAEFSLNDFLDSIRKVIYHLDYPVAGPGSFPQYQISKVAAQHRKVLLGGQGGDEIFGGYTRYLIAYFEQCIKAGIDGTMNNGNFVVTYESIIPNLGALKNYKPLIQDFFKEGLFGDLDQRYFRLINRSPTLKDEIKWDQMGQYDPFPVFQRIFKGENVENGSLFDKMTHFDFKTLLPALLQVEDRMSMAHGLESRVPFLDHPLVELAATMPATIKFKNGTLKKALLNALKHKLPSSIVNRKDKMGFPVPLNHWIKSGKLNEFLNDVFGAQKSRERGYRNNEAVIKNLQNESSFSRKIWGLLSLELWHQQFEDQESQFKKILKGENLTL